MEIGNPNSLAWKFVLSASVAFFALRFLVKYVLSYRVGFYGFTDFDLVPPGLCAAFLFCLALFKVQMPKLKWRPRFGVGYGLAVCFFLALTASLKFYGVQAGAVLYWLWLFFAIGLVLSVVFLAISPRYFTHHPKAWLLVPAFFLLVSKVLWVHLVEPLWQLTTALTGRLAYALIYPFYRGAGLEITTLYENTYARLNHPNFSLVVGSGCSGLEGMFFFGFIWIFLSLNRDDCRFGSEWFLSFIGGLYCLYLVNLIRIALLFGIADFSIGIFGKGALVYVVGSFHHVLGWALYTTVTFAYWKWCSRGVLAARSASKWQRKVEVA